jgi:hypothetical protein
MRDFLHTDNRQLWLLIGLCVATVFTIEAVEEAVEGVWPNQRRPAQMAPRGRAVHAVWGFVALLVLPGMLLAIGNLAVLLWQDLEHTDAQLLGSFFVGLGWLIFVLVSVDLFRLGRYMSELGLVGPATLILMLLVGDALLLVSFLDIVPSAETIRDAIRDALPII